MKLCNERDNRLHMVLAAGVVVLLDKYTYKGSKDIIIGVPIYKQEIEGDFINTLLALRNRLTEGMSFKELLLEVRKTVRAARPSGTATNARETEHRTAATRKSGRSN